MAARGRGDCDREDCAHRSALPAQEVEYEAALDQWRYLELPSEEDQALGVPDRPQPTNPGVGERSARTLSWWCVATRRLAAGAWRGDGRLACAAPCASIRGGLRCLPHARPRA